MLTILRNRSGAAAEPCFECGPVSGAWAALDRLFTVESFQLRPARTQNTLHIRRPDLCWVQRAPSAKNAKRGHMQLQAAHLTASSPSPLATALTACTQPSPGSVAARDEATGNARTDRWLMPQANQHQPLPGMIQLSDQHVPPTCSGRSSPKKAERYCASCGCFGALPRTCRPSLNRRPDTTCRGRSRQIFRRQAVSDHCSSPTCQCMIR